MSIIMATSGMWKLIHLFGRLFGDKLYVFPYKISTSNKQMLLVRNMSRSRRCFHVFGITCVVCHTLFCFACLCQPFFSKKHQKGSIPDLEESDAVKVVRVYVQILSALFPPSFFGMNYVITFMQVIPEIILCKIAGFQKETQGNVDNGKIVIFWTY